MLVLTRKTNQQLLIGNDIVITVVKVRGNTIRLGIEAPKDVRIVRSELEFKIKIDTDQPAEAAPLADLFAAAVADQADREAAPADKSASALNTQKRSTLASIARNKLQSRATGSFPTSSNLRTPLDPGRSASKASASNGHPQDPAAGRNLEDSPLCHRAPLSQRAGFKFAAHS